VVLHWTASCPPMIPCHHGPPCYGAFRPSCATCSHPFGGAAITLWNISSSIRVLCPDHSMGLRRRYCPHTIHGYFPVQVIQVSRWIGLAASLVARYTPAFGSLCFRRKQGTFATAVWSCRTIKKRTMETLPSLNAVPCSPVDTSAYILLYVFFLLLGQQYRGQIVR